MKNLVYVVAAVRTNSNLSGTEKIAESGFRVKSRFFGEREEAVRSADFYNRFTDDPKVKYKVYEALVEIIEENHK